VLIRSCIDADLRSQISNLQWLVADIAFIGQERLLRALTYFGVDVLTVASAQEAEHALRELTGGSPQPYRLIYVEETLAEDLRASLSALNAQALPVISIVSSCGKPRGLGKTMLHHLVRKATGVDLSIED
jgi:vacuolar-type H+-ATPase subunit F/Vma7